MKGLSRSESLAYPQDYRTVGKNPILICLLDQMKCDQELSTKYPNQSALLDDIIAALETERINWQSDFNLMSSEQWIQKMQTDPKFYWHCVKNSSEMQEYENLLLDLAAQCLERGIQLMPFLEEDDLLTFRSVKPPKTPTFHILSCQNLKQANFFVSVQMN